MTSSAGMQRLIAERDEEERNMSDSFVDKLYKEVTRKNKRERSNSRKNKGNLTVVMGKVV